MRCLPLLTVSSDEPIWVRREAFFAYFDQDDFRCRQTINVAHAYLADWFHKYEEEGANHFELPAFQIVDGRTQFINGRHRTAVLLEYLDYLPLAYVPRNRALTPDVAPIGHLRQITHRQLDISEHIDLPDLPIMESIP